MCLNLSSPFNTTRENNLSNLKNYEYHYRTPNQEHLIPICNIALYPHENKWLKCKFLRESYCNGKTCPRLYIHLRHCIIHKIVCSGFWWIEWKHPPIPDRQCIKLTWYIYTYPCAALSIKQARSVFSTNVIGGHPCVKGSVHSHIQINKMLQRTELQRALC